MALDRNWYSNKEHYCNKSISKEQNMVVTKRDFCTVLQKNGKQVVSTDVGTWYPPQAYKFLNLQHHIHSSNKKSIIIERTIQYIKKIEPIIWWLYSCRKKNCKLEHVKQWLTLFADYYNSELTDQLYRDQYIVDLLHN